MASLFRIFKKKSASRHTILIDVGTFSIRSLLVEYGTGGLIGLKKQSHIFARRERSSRLAESIGERLREIIFRAVKSVGKVPEAVVVGLASQITHNAVEISAVTRKEKNRDLTAEEIQNAVLTFQNEHREIERGKEMFILADAEVVRLTLDGYDIPPAKAVGARGAELGITSALTYIRKDLFHELQKLKGFVGGISLRIVPMHATVATLLTRENPRASFLLVKIGGAVTEISAVEDGILLWTEPVPFGGEHTTAAIAKVLEISESRAEDLKRQYGVLKLPARMEAEVAKIAHSEITQLQTHIRDVLVQKKWLLPETAYIYGGGAHLSGIQETLGKSSWFSDLSYREQLRVQILDAGQFAKRAFVNTVLRGPEDIDLVALALIHGTKHTNEQSNNND